MPKRPMCSPEFFLGFFCTADWRWVSAQALASEPRRRAVVDPWVRRVENYLRGRPDKVIAAATEIRNAPESGSPGIRTLLDSYLLAETDVAEVANRISLPVDVVEAYARIFFDVSAKLQATDWVSLRVLNGGVAASFRGDLAACVRYAGYSGGAAVAAVVWAVLADRPIPAWVPDRNQYDCPLAREKVRLTVAVMKAASPREVADAIRKMQSVRRSTRKLTRTKKVSPSMLELQEQFLSTKILGKSAAMPKGTTLPANLFHNEPGARTSAQCTAGKKAVEPSCDLRYAERDANASLQVEAPQLLPQAALRKKKTRVPSEISEAAATQSEAVAASGQDSAARLLDQISGRVKPAKKRAAEPERVRISVTS